MDPIAPTLFMALAGGTAGAAGQQLWTSLRDLVRRPFAHQEAPGGEGELETFLGTPENSAERDRRARELAEVLTLRARQDPDFAKALTIWQRDAEQATGPRTGTGDVHNENSGGTVHGNLLQARDINGPITFGG